MTLFFLVLRNSYWGKMFPKLVIMCSDYRGCWCVSTASYTRNWCKVIMRLCHRCRDRNKYEWISVRSTKTQSGQEGCQKNRNRTQNAHKPVDRAATLYRVIFSPTRHWVRAAFTGNKKKNRSTTNQIQQRWTYSAASNCRCCQPGKLPQHKHNINHFLHIFPYY